MSDLLSSPRVKLLPPAGGPRSDTGATAVEYAIMVSLIVGVIVGSVSAFGMAVVHLFDVPWP